MKLLDARERLSLQVHPRDDDPALGPLESGKPEAWVVLAHAPGAGVWLGLAEGVTRADVERAVAAHVGIEALLNFVPVAVGDAFVIEAGTVHAVGAGVTLLEPQLVSPGKTGVTYRFWDWGRRYDAAGRESHDGLPRPLQLQRSLDATAWHAPRGAAFVAACRRTPRREQHGAVTLAHYFELKGIRLTRLAGDGPLTLPGSGSFSALVVTGGALALGDLRARAGETLAIPAAWRPWPLALEGAEAYLVST